jgi:hypothetical protein
MLVSSVETAAVEWASKAEPVEQLKLAFPKLVKLISESNSPDLLEPNTDPDCRSLRNAASMSASGQLRRVTTSRHVAPVAQGGIF